MTAIAENGADYRRFYPHTSIPEPILAHQSPVDGMNRPFMRVHKRFFDGLDERLYCTVLGDSIT
jgi:hypothetical protein